jgi:hypothetical protein
MRVLLKKVVGLRYKFSSFDRYKASEVILKTMYDHDEHIKEGFEGLLN